MLCPFWRFLKISQCTLIDSCGGAPTLAFHRQKSYVVEDFSLVDMYKILKLKIFFRIGGLFLPCLIETEQKKLPYLSFV